MESTTRQDIAAAPLPRALITLDDGIRAVGRRAFDDVVGELEPLTIEESCSAILGRLARNEVIEVRALSSGSRAVHSGCFNDAGKMAAAVRRLDGRADIYFTVNPVDSALLARGNNKLRPAGTTTGDADITRRATLAFDLDPERPKGIPAAEGEHYAAINVAERVRRWLYTLGWPEPLLMDSGNGAWLLYSIHVPNDAAASSLVKRCLAAVHRHVAESYPASGIKVDEAVGNAARIARLPGTINCKGEDVREQRRMRRRARIIARPRREELVTTLLLDRLAVLAPDSATVAASHESRGSTRKVTATTRLNVAEWCERFGLKVVKSGAWRDRATIWNLASCPFSSDGHDGAYITQQNDGGMGFGCHHTSCVGHRSTWKDLRAHVGDRAPTDSTDADKRGTEAGDAEFFASLYGERVRYDHRRAQWLIVGPRGHWLPDRVGEITQLGKDAMREQQRVALLIDDHERKKKLVKWAIDGESRKRMANMLAIAQSEPLVRDAGDAWDTNPELLGVKNGVVNLRTGELRDARPEDRITRQAGTDYDPGAKSELWENTLREIFLGDEELIDFVHVAFGLTATGDTSRDCWFIQNGAGRNGKGTINNAIYRALGDYSLELPAAILDRKDRGQPYDLANLPGARFIRCSEAGDSIVLHHDRVKQLTGGDSFRAADKYQKSFEFTPCGKLWLACNKMPRATDDSPGFWARVFVIPFRASFLHRENRSIRPALEQDPKHQRAVLAWLVRGARRYYESGLPQCAAVMRATGAYEEASAPVADFLAERCLMQPGARAGMMQLFKAYTSWVPHGARRLTRPEFQSAMRRQFTVDPNDSRTVTLLGVGLLGGEDLGF